jgi:glycosyltransferase involved in cell wall biosynthesis
MYASIKITVVTPSFNQGRFIEETIKSIISQEGNFFLEYIIMDGGSTDDTVEVIKKYERLLREKKYPVRCKGVEFSWVSEKDKGQAHAVNKGFKLATGEVLGWVNSDDTYMPGAIAKALEYFEKNKDAMMVYGEGYYIDEHGKTIERYKTEPFNYQRLAEHCFICQPSAFLRRRVLDEVGYLDEGLHFCMDLDLWIRIGKNRQIGYLNEYLATSRLHSDAKTVAKTKDAYIELIKTIKKYYGHVTVLVIDGYVHALLGRYLKRKTKLQNLLFMMCRAVLLKYKTILLSK